MQMWKNEIKIEIRAQNLFFLLSLILGYCCIMECRQNYAVENVII